jgi:hypothetical protein
VMLQIMALLSDMKRKNVRTVYIGVGRGA